MLCVLVDIESIHGAQGKGHDGVGVVSKVISFDLKKNSLSDFSLLCVFIFDK